MTNTHRLYSFLYDYSEGCHPAILTALNEGNLVQQPGYGDDIFSAAAKDLIKKEADAPHAHVYFVSGGTQTNLVVIHAALKSYEAVISADTGHINVNETGAIEATGHKILTIASADGKITPAQIQEIADNYHHFPHVVKPAMVYISNATETGAIYSTEELKNISQCCRKNKLLLFMDGARLAAALCSEDNDLTLADVAQLTDVFYIGGTKNGALLGEAVVINNPALQEGFSFHLKQRGALLAKGRILGIQFQTLFSNQLFYQLATHANACAKTIAQAAIEAGYSFLTKPQTNQLFIILPYDKIKKLQEKYAFYVWKKMDEDRACIRVVTSWATDKKMVDAFINDLKNHDHG